MKIEIFETATDKYSIELERVELNNTIRESVIENFLDFTELNRIKHYNLIENKEKIEKHFQEKLANPHLQIQIIVEPYELTEIKE
jgi:hypothetical protein